MTGASGAQYGLRLLECLVKAGCTVYLMVSKAALLVVATETDFKLPAQPKKMVDLLSKRFDAREGQIKVFSKEDWTSPVASGSGAPGQMVVCPCSTGTLSSIAVGACDNLIERAADVVLKEKNQLILVPRETPFSTVHLQNMLTLSRMGATILPASPGFYHWPKTIEDMVDFVVARILSHLDIEQDMVSKWGED